VVETPGEQELSMSRVDWSARARPPPRRAAARRGELVEDPVGRLKQVDRIHPMVLDAVPAGHEPASRQQASHRRVLRHQGRAGTFLVRRDATEHLGERQVWQGAVTEVQAVAGDSAPARLLRQLGELGKDPRLADPGVTGEEHSPGAPLGPQADQRRELLEIVVAADEWTVR
jgi:hypothetical protein